MTRLLSFTLVAAIAIQGATIYDESISGDLSDSGLSATVLSFTSGSNQVLGTTGISTSFDRDYFTFTVPVGLQLDAIMLLSGTSFSSSVSFIGMQAGTQVTLPTSPPSADGLLGWHHYGPGDIGQDILDDMSVPVAGSSGFSIPLAAGSYAIWIQETGPGPQTYGFDFMIGSSVPEPSTFGMLISALTGACLLRRLSLKRGRS